MIHVLNPRTAQQQSNLHGLWVLMIRGSMDCEEGPTPVGVWTTGEVACEKSQYLLLSGCCEPKTALKHKVYFYKRQLRKKG